MCYRKHLPFFLAVHSLLVFGKFCSDEPPPPTIVIEFFFSSSVSLECRDLTIWLWLFTPSNETNRCQKNPFFLHEVGIVAPDFWGSGVRDVSGNVQFPVCVLALSLLSIGWSGDFTLKGSMMWWLKLLDFGTKGLSGTESQIVHFPAVLILGQLLNLSVLQFHHL